MKRYFLAFTLFLLTVAAYAQKDYYRYQVELGVGSSLVGNVARSAFSSMQLEHSVIPVVGGSFYVNYRNNTSLGFSVYDQKYSVWGTLDTLADFSLGINRLNISAAGRYTYKAGSSWNLYTALRFGVTLWKIRSTVTTDVLESLIDQYLGQNILSNYAKSLISDFNQVSGTLGGSMFSLQFTLLGFAKNFGNLRFYSELTIGSPYYFTAGLAYRFNTNARGK